MDQRICQHCNNINFRYISGLEVFLGQKKSQLGKCMHEKKNISTSDTTNYSKSFQKLWFQCLVWAKETNTEKCNDHFVEEKIGARGDS